MGAHERLTRRRRAQFALAVAAFDEAARFGAVPAQLHAGIDVRDPLADTEGQVAVVKGKNMAMLDRSSVEGRRLLHEGAAVHVCQRRSLPLHVTRASAVSRAAPRRL